MNLEGMTAVQKQYQLVRGKGSFKLVLEDAAVVPPQDHEILIRMRAVSLNRRDLMVATGQYPTSLADRLVPVSDGAGEVVAVGSQAKRFKVGDRVAPTFFQNWDSGRSSHKIGVSTLGNGGESGGLLSQYVTLHERGAVAVPGYLSFEEAATLPCAALTAWSALFTHGQLRAGDQVLLQGTGGVSIFGLQFARAAGATGIITSSSDAKLARAKAHGAVVGINYKTMPEWEKAVLAATNNLGVQHVVETGGAGTLAQSLASMGFGCHVGLIGGLTAFGGDIPVSALRGRNASATGITVGSRAEFEAMLIFMELYRIQPVIDKSFAFPAAMAAYEYLDTGSHFGKVVIRIG